MAKIHCLAPSTFRQLFFLSEGCFSANMETESESRYRLQAAYRQSGDGAGSVDRHCPPEVGHGG